MRDIIHNCGEYEQFEIIKPFIEKSFALFEDEFSMSVNKVECVNIETNTTINNINFVSTLSGGINANLIFSFERELAKEVLKNFAFLEYEEEMEEEMISEVVAEFLNIVIGNAIKDFNLDTRFNFSPPIGLFGEGKIFKNKSSDICKIKFDLNSGSMLIIYTTEKK